LKCLRGALALDTDSAAVSQVVSKTPGGRTSPQRPELPEPAVHHPAGRGCRRSGNRGQMRQGAGNAISINGGRPESNNYTLDGLANTDTAPEYASGHSVPRRHSGIQGAVRNLFCGVSVFSANQVNLVSRRRAANDIHGSVFLFWPGNDALDAINDCSQSSARAGATGNKKQNCVKNQFGFVARRTGLYSQALRRTKQDLLAGELRRMAY